jgi:hypothetical protein
MYHKSPAVFTAGLCVICNNVLHALANVNGWLDVYPDYAEKYAKLKKLTQGMAESKIEKMTIDERVMRLPDGDKEAIIKFIERMEKINELV